MKPLLTKMLLALAVGVSLHVEAADTSDGEVRKVDKAQAKVTIKHGEIKNLDMPPMTMVFAVKDKAALDTLKVGDKVKFVATKEGGTYTVTEIRVSP